MCKLLTTGFLLVLWSIPAPASSCAALLTAKGDLPVRALAVATPLEPTLNRWGGRLGFEESQRVQALLRSVFDGLGVRERATILIAALGDESSRTVLTQIVFEGEGDVFVGSLLHTLTAYGGILVDGNRTTPLWRLLTFLSEPTAWASTPISLPTELGPLAARLEPVLNRGGGTLPGGDFREIVTALSFRFVGVPLAERHEVMVAAFSEGAPALVDSIDSDGSSDQFAIRLAVASRTRQIVVGGASTTALWRLLEHLSRHP